MDVSRALLIVGITVVVVVLINVGIYLSVMRHNTVGEIEKFRKAMQQARDPWQKERNDLEELAGLVAQLNRPEKRGDVDG